MTTIANLTSGSTTAVSSVATASITLTTNRLGLLTVVNRTASAATPNAPTCSGWAEVATIAYDNTGTSRERVTLLRRLSGSDSTGTHTIDFAAQSQENIRWSIDETDATVDTGGSNGASAVVQSVTNSAATATSLTVTLAAFGSASNATFGCFGLSADGVVGTPVITEGTGFTQLTEIAAVDASLFTQYRNDNDTTVDCSSTLTHVTLGGIAIEIKAAAAGGTVTAWLRA
jgi:hypothetical protein